MNTESKAVERAKGKIMELLDFEEPTTYLSIYNKIAIHTTWKAFQQAMRDLKAESRVHIKGDGGYRKTKPNRG